MSRFDRGARRVMDARGRFVKVSKDEYQRLKAVTEEPAIIEFSSPANSTMSDTQVPEGWRPKGDDDGADSPVTGGPGEQGSEFGGTPNGGKDGGQERGSRWNPTIHRIQAKARIRSGRFNGYHPFPLPMDARRKINRA